MVPVAPEMSIVIFVFEISMSVKDHHENLSLDIHNDIGHAVLERVAMSATSLLTLSVNTRDIPTLLRY